MSQRYTVKHPHKHNKIISAVLITAILLMILFIHIANRPPVSPESVNAGAGADYSNMPVSYIGSSNIGVNEQDISKLKGSSIAFRDNFNIKLSHNNFFYTDSIDVEITTDIPQAEIFYSLDGSIPSPDNGIKYTEPVRFEKGDYNTAYVIKVMAYTVDDESHPLTHTYFVSDQIADRFSTFVFAISTDNDNLYGYENGILVEGKLRDEYIAEHGRRDIIPPSPANFNIRGRESEREAYIEVFTPNGECVISQNAGIRVRGGWSRAANKKSLGLYARDEYDPVFDKFNYEFFPGDRMKDEYGSFITSYSTLLLRNGGNDRDGAFMREELSQLLAKDAGFLDYKNVAPACIFLNGEYYGFFWLEQSYGDSYFTDYYGEVNKSYIERQKWEEPETGDLTVEENFLAYSEIMDIDNYMLYYAFQIYTGNRDWPHNNKRYWRFSGGGAEYINKYYDGKYRMLLFDDEMGWGIYSQGYREKTIQRILRDKSSKSFVAFMKREDMVEKFCNQMFDLMNTVFVYDSVAQAFDKLVAAYEDELSVSIKARAINNWMKMSDVRSEQRNILRFANGRRNIVIEDMVSSFKLENSDIYYVTANGNANASVTLNTLSVSGEGQLNSCYFFQHPAVLKAEVYDGYIFDYWEINGQKHYSAEINLDANFASDDGQIDAFLFVKSSDTYSVPVINAVRLDDNFDYIELHNPGNAEFTVENLFLSNDKNNLHKFQIEKIKFPAKSFAGYYGSNYESYKGNGKYMFDFKIQKGDTIYLSDADGNILQELKTTKNINENEVIKRLADGSYMIFKAE